MPRYTTLGEIPPKRHVRFQAADGTQCCEELLGQDGFASASSLLYHRRSPSALTRVEPIGGDEPGTSADHPLRPRHLRPVRLEFEEPSDMVGARRTLFANRDLRVGWAGASGASPLYRNADGDELVYVHRGSAVLESSFGRLDVAAGDYVVIPRSAVHRWRPAEPLSALVVEARGHVGPPSRYLSATGQFLEHSPYCERDVRVPSELVSEAGAGAEVIVRSRGRLSLHVHQHHPFDVVGWDGCVYPWALNIADFEPIVGSIHQPPPVHQTFEGPGFVVCSFVPRPLDFHPGSVKTPYHHANTDSDELLFYAAGEFTSRRGSGVSAGSLTYHPAGFVHGPQPGSAEALADEMRTAETAVMIDTFTPLEVSEAARAIDEPGYLESWLT